MSHSILLKQAIRFKRRGPNEETSRSHSFLVTDVEITTVSQYFYFQTEMFTVVILSLFLHWTLCVSLVSGLRDTDVKLTQKLSCNAEL